MRARPAARRISSDATTASPRSRRKAASTAAKRATTTSAGAATSQDEGIASCTSSGLKLKNVETTTSAVTAPIGAARDAKYPARPVIPRRAYASAASGTK